MDISKFNTTKACNKPGTLKVRDPFNSKKILEDKDGPLEIYLLGIHSDVAKNAMAEQSRAYEKNQNMTDAEKAKVGAEFLAKLTTGWSKNLSLGSDKLEFSFDNAVKVYLSEDWLGKQALEYSTNLRNYDPNA